MKNTKEQLKEYIKLYLNDVSDYSDNDEQFIIAEETLNSLNKNLITESITDINLFLIESINNANIKNREVLMDFKLYIENIN